MKIVKSILLSFVLFLNLVAAMPIATASAGSGGASKGDAEAAFQSWNTGLRALRFISSAGAAAPQDGFRATILPVFSDGNRYCADDWHVIMLAWISGGDDPYTMQNAKADLAISNTFYLDGEELSLSRTPVVRRVASAFFANEYGFAVGTIMSPDAIGLGVRTLYSEFEFPDGTTETDIIHFYNDPSGSPACAG